MPEQHPLLCVDMGTTRTRVWLTHGSSVRAYTTGDFGVRDVSMGKDRSWLRARLTELLRTASRDASEAPKAILAAGMITSNVGLQEVPHAQAPAGASELAARLFVDKLELTRNLFLPMLLVPGVRTGVNEGSPQDALDTDLMRGEETLCMGLMASGRLDSNTVLLTLGSHWKAIWTDEHARIVRCRTTLTGEMIHAVQTHTLLASSLPQEAPRQIDSEWLQIGFIESQRNGLGHALFGVRLLHLYNQGTPEQRLAFLYGAFVQTELSKIGELAREGKQMLVVGSECVAEAWALYAKPAGIRCIVLPEEERQSDYLAGLQKIYETSAFHR